MSGNKIFNFYDQSRIVIGRVINQYSNYKDDEEENITESDFEILEEEVFKDVEGECGKEMQKTPEILNTDKARKVFRRLAEAGVLNNNFMPMETLSWSKKGALASLLAIELNIENTWKVFGAFWNVDSESLRSGYNKAREMEFKYEFDKKIMNILK